MKITKNERITFTKKFKFGPFLKKRMPQLINIAISCSLGYFLIGGLVSSKSIILSWVLTGLLVVSSLELFCFIVLLICYYTIYIPNLVKEQINVQKANQINN